jgi:HK97 family phage portal protein
VANQPPWPVRAQLARTQAMRSEAATNPAPVVPSVPAGAVLPGVLPPTRQAATAITLDRALGVTAAYRAVSILTTAAGQLTLEAVRGGAVVASTFLDRPDPDISVTKLVKRLTVGLAGTGNAYLRKFYAGPETSAALVGVRALDPLRTSVHYDENGRKSYRYLERGRQLELSASEVTHLRLLEVPGHDYGLGPVEACRLTLAGALDLHQYADQWFSESGVPTGVLSSDQHLNKDAADMYRERWHQTQARRDVAVLGLGLTYSPIVLNPADAQFLESRQFSVTDVARMFGIPAAYLLAEVNGSSMTYQSLEMADTQFVRYTLMSYLTEIEDAFSDLLPRGQRARFDLAGLLRPDTMTRAKVHQAYRAMGVLSVNEVRADEGLAPIADGDEHAAPAPAPALEPAPTDEKETTK